MIKIRICAITCALASLAGCSDSTEIRHVCSCQELSRAAAFVSDNVSKANNMSDEEMEDVIMELRRTAIMLSCHQEKVVVDWIGDIRTELLVLDSCETVMPRFL